LPTQFSRMRRFKDVLADKSDSRIKHPNIATFFTEEITIRLS
jgi:hypothetical protein